MLCGLPGSGKSDFAMNIFSKDCVFSSDDIRKELGVAQDDSTKNAIVFKTLEENLVKSLTLGKNVVYDACNISERRRRTFLNCLKNERRISGFEKTCVLFATPKSVCYERVDARERKVPHSVIDRMYKNFNVPYYSEGWDRIFVVYPENTEFYNPFDLVASLNDVNQDNGYHTYSLGKHMEKAYKIAKQNKFPLEVQYAALLHDIGKQYTKTFYDTHGVLTEHAHYYAHEHVSSYEALFSDCASRLGDNTNLLEVCYMINNHMKPYQWNGNRQKYVIRWGEDLYNKIMQLHLCDMKAK